MGQSEALSSAGWYCEEHKFFKIYPIVLNGIPYCPIEECTNKVKVKTIDDRPSSTN